jgi:MFS family permease
MVAVFLVRRAGAVFALLGAVQVALIAAITILTVALPTIQRDLHVNDSGLVLIASAYGISFGGLLLVGGRLVDLLGRRTAFVIGTVVFGVSSAAAGLAAGPAMLLGARFGQGAVRPWSRLRLSRCSVCCFLIHRVGHGRSRSGAA